MQILFEADFIIEASQHSETSLRLIYKSPLNGANNSVNFVNAPQQQPKYKSVLQIDRDKSEGTGCERVGTAPAAMHARSCGSDGINYVKNRNEAA